MTSLGKGIAVIGLILLVSGGLMMLLGRAGVGPLPGDIDFRRGPSACTSPSVLRSCSRSS